MVVVVEVLLRREVILLDQPGQGPVEEVLRRMSHSRSDAPPFVAVKLPHCLSRLFVQVFPEGVS